MCSISVSRLLISHSPHHDLRKSPPPPPPQPWVQYRPRRRGCRHYNSQFNFVFGSNQFWECFLADNKISHLNWLPNTKSRNPRHLSVFLSLQRHGQRQHSYTSRGLWSLPEAIMRTIRLLHNLSLWTQLLHTGMDHTPHFANNSFPLGVHLPHAWAPVLGPCAGLPAAAARGQLGGPPALDTQAQGIPQVRTCLT